DNVTFSGRVETNGTINSIVITDAQGGSITVDAADITVDGNDVTVAGQDLSSLADGELTVTMTVTDEAGNQGSVDDTAILDTVAPGDGTGENNNIAFDAADGLINDGEKDNVTFSGRVETNGTINSIVITDAQGGSITVDAADITVDGNDVTVAGQDLSSLADGELTVTMTVTDEAGNQGSVDDTAILDTVAPGDGTGENNNIAFDAADGLINDGEKDNVTFSGRVETNGTINSIVITDAQGGSITVDAADITVDGNDVTVAGQDLSSLADGELTVTMTVTDEAGNQGSVDDTAILDTVAPGDGTGENNNIAFDAADGLINDGEKDNVTFSGRVETNGTINSIVITDAQGGSITVDAADITVDGNDVTVAGQDLSSLADGELTVTMTVTDEAGNQGSVDDTAILDTVAPGDGTGENNNIAFDAADGLINDGEKDNVTFSGRVETNGTINSIVITDAQGGSITVDAADITVDGNDVTVAGQDLSSLADGELTVTMTVTDEAGNQGSVDDTAILDTVAPGDGTGENNNIAFDAADGLINDGEKDNVTFSGRVETNGTI
ncbi:beta strand repeat-containing protein, partial [Halomonas sp. GFAJ-1]|uniref:beta strand repeat-containing protein n=1 Tax=Halomonas sp. GFAJ-1 TaxID=1118153 RepID=UPI00023A2A24